MSEAEIIKMAARITQGGQTMKSSIEIDAATFSDLDALIDHVTWVGLYATLPDDALDQNIVDSAVERVRQWLDCASLSVVWPET
jgi:hypothetical protein